MTAFLRSLLHGFSLSIAFWSPALTLRLLIAQTKGDRQ